MFNFYVKFRFFTILYLVEWFLQSYVSTFFSFQYIAYFRIIKRILFLEHLYEKIISDTESCLVENLAYRFFVSKSVIRRVEAVSNPEMMPGL